MKKLLLILCLSSILPLLGQTTPNRSVVGWEKLPTGTNSDLADVCCLDAEIIIVTTNDGKILKTTDGGLTWSTKYQHDNRIIRSLKFTENNVGYCLGLDAFNNNPVLLRTTDGGDDWSVVSEFDELSYNASLFPVDADTLYVYNDRRFMLMKSTDGGVTFEDVGLVIGDLFEPYDMFFEDNVGYFAGQNFVFNENGFTVYKTVDYGASWLTVLTLKDVPGFSNPRVYYFKAYFWDKDRVQLYFMASSDTYDGAFLLETSDGFGTYTVASCDLIGSDVTAIKFINERQGCCVVEPEIPLKEYSSMVGISEDAGCHWKGVMEGIKKDADIFAMDGTGPYFYLASNDGVLYKSLLDNPEWYYEIQNENGSITYQHLEYVSDTTINSHRPKVLIRTNTLYDKYLHIQVSHEYIYEQNDTVYWWNKALEEFTMLYDFGAETGEEWTIHVGTESFMTHVDSVGSVEYEDYTYRVLHVSDPDGYFTGDIVCGIGHLSSFFPERLMKKLHPDNLYSVDGLRCYWQDGHLFLKFGNDDCDAIYNGIHEVSEDAEISFMVYPNPTKGTLVINYSAFRIPHLAFHILNLLGQTVLSGSFVVEGRRHDMTSLQTIDVSSLAPGVYFITIDNLTEKFIVSNK